jgi:hypothetical protein
MKMQKQRQVRKMFHAEKKIDNFAVLQDLCCKNGAASIQPITLLQKYKSAVL